MIAGAFAILGRQVFAEAAGLVSAGQCDDWPELFSLLMTDQEMQDWLFERYTNLPEYYREEISDGTFNVRDCCFRMMIEVEEQKDEAAKRIEELEALLETARIPICVGRPIIEILAKEGAWSSENGNALVAADCLFGKNPYQNVELCQPCPPSTPPRQETAAGQGLA